MATTAKRGGATVTAIVVRYLDGRPAVIDDDSDDMCIVYEPDTAPAAAAWLIAERVFVQWCKRSEAIAEVVMVTVPMPADPADLEASLQVAARATSVSFGFVRVADLYVKAG